MRPLLIPIVLFLICGCATQQSSRISFEEAYASTALSAPSVEALPVVKQKPRIARTPPQAQPAFELQAGLITFANRARAERSRSAPGAAMPSGAVKNWLQLNATLDDLLRRSPENTSSHDVIRARVTAEAELEMDARAYGDIPVALAESVLVRVSRLGLRMAEVRRMGVTTAKRQTLYGWPVSPVSVTSLYGRRLHPMTRTYKQHAGVDLAASTGQTIFAAAKGAVVRAGWNGAHGIQVEVMHEGGVITRYSHLSEVLVEPGLVVKKGEPLGLAGSTGQSTGAHLHFEFWREGRTCDPLEELGKPAAELNSMASL